LFIAVTLVPIGGSKPSKYEVCVGFNQGQSWPFIIAKFVEFCSGKGIHRCLVDSFTLVSFKYSDKESGNKPFLSSIYQNSGIIEQGY
jgi:hypothetical protein